MRLAALAVALLACHAAQAQVVTVFSPVVPAPVIAAPVVVSPAPVVAYRPVSPFAPVAVASPVVAAPAVITPAYVPTPVVTTRYRPILGGTVSRVRYRYAPVGVVTPLY